MEQITFGPVPSRRLGRSIGINNIPPEIKICSFSCVYCQLGKVCRMSNQTHTFFSPEQIEKAVAAKLDSVRKNNQEVDFLTIVPDGEPTLDENLGESVQRLKKFNLPLAIITNGTLLNRKETIEVLNQLDLVSVKVDAASEKIWRMVDRPVKGLDFEGHFYAIEQFATQYKGKLITESMLIRDMNTAKHELHKMADYLKKLKPHKAYISVPTRPTAIKGALPPTQAQLNLAYQVYSDAGLKAELLTGYEGNEFSSSGNLHDDILAITAVHPMREDAVKTFLRQNNGAYSIVEEMIKNDELYCSEFEGKKYYTRKLKKISGK